MNCQESPELLALYCDGELDALRAASVERHLHACTACATRHDAFLGLRADIRENVVYHTAPPGLRRRVSSPEVHVLRRSAILAGAAMGCAATVLALVLASVTIDYRETSSVRHQAVARHVDATLADRLVAVASEDRHTVKPWLTARLDFAPPVKDLAGEGFALVGARVDALDGRDVAALVYRYRDHRIGVFVRPRDGRDTEPELLAERGFNVVQVRRGRMEWWVVSDLNAPQLRDFAAALARDG